jgi:hypothetical protein
MRAGLRDPKTHAYFHVCVSMLAERYPDKGTPFAYNLLQSLCLQPKARVRECPRLIFGPDLPINVTCEESTYSCRRFLKY